MLSSVHTVQAAEQRPGPDLGETEVTGERTPELEAGCSTHLFAAGSPATIPGRYNIYQVSMSVFAE